ncbi:WXG100 family type VII secretion target [Actinoplanes lobatus]|uniref:WXG100 family type VII secretion target n=2 Tax=Actinoplanes lobatus TaxID=113568 RepID=A0A7W7MGH6_9ACTN|nr:WXG100 family type VII secretion target [Actinoplanes lobatus]MBB4749313.1 WXG100 family type VII secretion target [Actinoplanes lobatus]
MAGTPGMGQVHATQEQLSAMAGRCSDTGQNISSGMNQLLGQIQGLSGGAFAGTANNALQDVSAQLNDGLTKIMQALDELGGKMSAASQTYGTNDEEAAQDLRAAAAGGADSSVINALRG